MIALLVTSALAALVACSGGGQPHGADAADAAPDSRSSDSAPRASVCGSLEQISSAIPIAGGDAVLCNATECHSGKSGTTGAFCIHVNVAGAYVLHVSKILIGSKRFGDVVFPVAVSAADLSTRALINLGRVVMPAMGAAVSLDPKVGGVLDLGGGVRLTVPAGATTLPALTTAAEVAAVRVDAADVHPNLIKTRAAAPALVYAVLPLETFFSPPIAFEFPAGSLAAGAGVDIYLFNYEKGKIEAAGEGTVSAAGVVTEVSGKGLSGLGWLLFYTK